MKNLSILCGMLLSIAGPVFAEKSWAVHHDQATCLLENLSAYLESEDEPIVIFLAACPVVDRMAALQALQQNNGSVPTGPTVFVMDDGSQKEPDEVIVYTQSELACLEDIEIRTSQSPVFLPQSPCEE